MKRIASLLLAAMMIAGCKNENRVTISGTLTRPGEEKVYLDLSEVDRTRRVDSATVRKGKFRFVTQVNGPEFYQVRLPNSEFVSLQVMPGEKIMLELGGSPLVMNYTVQGSPGSDDVRMLEQHLKQTTLSLDSVRELYSALTDDELTGRGPELDQAFRDLVDAQRKFNIRFVIENINSFSAIQALYQRFDENTYVLYQPRDLQYLKIVSDSLSVRYPVSRHVRALRENVTGELNQMYLDRIASLASELPGTNTTPELPDVNGRMVSVASLKGKYVLVSFWSSTHAESMEELPLLRSLYESYHRRGLEIFHVSLDVDEQRWKNVVRFEELPWISVREPDPSHPSYSRLMNITRLPSNLLYDPEGNIINKDLLGRNLTIRLDQIFNKQ